MQIADHETTDATVARPGLLPLFKGVAGLFAALMLVQAFLGGRGWFLDHDLIEVHGGVGAVVVLVAVAQAVLAFLVGAPSGPRRPLAILSGAILALAAAQYALGFATRDSAEAAASHIPTGVLIFGLTTANNATVFRLRR